ncbi:MAG TPA: MBL fold metallo-hydrolase [Bacteroidetes bacterium]|nr:MBL fold metallo-hydrolase [Bacteroidota bacterium]
MGDAFGASPDGERLARIERSPHYADGRFHNALPTVADGASFGVIWEYLTGGSDHRQPAAPLPVVARSAADFAEATASLRVTWLGHSTVLVEIDGTRVLLDPVWGERASPSPWAGAPRFYAPPLALAGLPDVDAVLISHDHYDHLDMPTVRALADRVPRWLVPLGVGAHLEAWGVAPETITEVDWWDEAEVAGVTLVSTPARHFSGRSLARDRTLWTGWGIVGDSARVWYSGDTALTPAFAEIGQRLGPFDLTLIESGAYDAAWADLHLGPEQAVAAHRLVQGGTGGLMVPVHWGLFDLALHGWTEPADRVRAAAAAAGVAVAFPRPGESLSPEAYPAEPWWPSLPAETAAQAPAVSSGLPDSVLALIPRPGASE